MKMINIDEKSNQDHIYINMAKSKWLKKFLAPVNPDQELFYDRVHKICKNWLTSLNIDSLTLTEDFKNQTSHVSCRAYLKHRASVPFNIDSYGKGLVDALYSGLVKELSPKYASLKGIKFIDFEVRADIDSKAKPGSDASCAAKLTIENARGIRFVFTTTDFSMNAAAVGVIRKTIEFFINAEIAMIRTHRSYRDAVSRARPDLIERYTLDLGILVKATCYKDLVADIKSIPND